MDVITSPKNRKPEYSSNLLEFERDERGVVRGRVVGPFAIAAVIAGIVALAIYFLR